MWLSFRMTHLPGTWDVLEFLVRSRVRARTWDGNANHGVGELSVARKNVGVGTISQGETLTRPCLLCPCLGLEYVPRLNERQEPCLIYSDFDN